MSEKDLKWPTLVLVITLFSVLSFGNFCLAQEKEEKKKKTKLRPSFTPGSGGGFAFRRNDIFKPGMDFRGKERESVFLLSTGCFEFATNSGR